MAQDQDRDRRSPVSRGSTRPRSTDDRLTDRSDEPDTEDDTTRPMTTARFPPAATFLIDNPDVRGSPINDDDPKAALELVRDAIRLEDTDVPRTTLKRGQYRVSIGFAPDDWEEPSEHALHLRCRTNNVIPDARDPATNVQTFATLWIKPVRVAREIVTDYLGPDAFEQFTPPRDDSEPAAEEEGR